MLLQDRIEKLRQISNSTPHYLLSLNLDAIERQMIYEYLEKLRVDAASYVVRMRPTRQYLGNTPDYRLLSYQQEQKDYELAYKMVSRRTRKIG